MGGAGIYNQLLGMGTGMRIRFYESDYGIKRARTLCIDLHDYSLLSRMKLLWIIIFRYDAFVSDIDNKILDSWWDGRAEGKEDGKDWDYSLDVPKMISDMLGDAADSILDTIQKNKAKK